MNLAEAFITLSASLPSEKSVTDRLGRAYDIVCREGYEIRHANNCWIVDKASTSALEDRSVSYTVIDEGPGKGSCTCPDYTSNENLRGGLCKHRLAVRLVRMTQETVELPSDTEMGPHNDQGELISDN